MTSKFPLIHQVNPMTLGKKNFQFNKIKTCLIFIKSLGSAVLSSVSSTDSYFWLRVELMTSITAKDDQIRLSHSHWLTHLRVKTHSRTCMHNIHLCWRNPIASQVLNYVSACVRASIFCLYILLVKLYKCIESNDQCDNGFITLIYCASKNIPRNVNILECMKREKRNEKEIFYWKSILRNTEMRLFDIHVCEYMLAQYDLYCRVKLQVYSQFADGFHRRKRIFVCRFEVDLLFHSL